MATSLRDGRQRQVTLNISTLDGGLHAIDAEDFETVREVKQKIERLTQIPYELQMLVFGTDELVDCVEVGTLACEDFLDLLLCQLPPDSDEWLERVGKDPLSLEHAPEHIRSDPRIVTVAAMKHGRAFNFASQELRGNRVFVLGLVAKNGCLLQAASIQLQADKAVVAEASVQNEAALAYAATALRRDRDFMICLLRRNACAISYAHYTIQKDPILQAMCVVG